MSARRRSWRRPVVGLAAAVLVVVAVLVITERRAELPRSSTCRHVDPGGIRLRAARPPTSTAGGNGQGEQRGQPAPATGAFRPANADAVYCEDLADPFVLVEGTVRRRYFAYGTNTAEAHIPLLLSGGLFQSERIVDALPHLPAWSTGGAVWAPSVLPLDGTFVLYYATTDAASGLQCISRATADDPEGPFEDASTAPLVCPTELGGAIDPSPFVERDGSAYLLWKADGNCCDKATGIYAQPLSEDGLTVTGAAREILPSTHRWEAGVVEAPAMVEHEGDHYLFYSGNLWDTPSYAIGYARCDGPLGPCTAPLDHPWLESGRGTAGPGGQELFTDGGGLEMVFGAWLNGTVGYEHGSFRSLYTVGVTFHDGAPVIER